MVAAALLSSINSSIAAENKAATSAQPTTTVSGKDAKAKGTTPKTKLVDINSATKAELKKLTGVDDAMADKIIAGRPYLSKAHLATRNIVSRNVYEQLKRLVIAKQK